MDSHGTPAVDRSSPTSRQPLVRVVIGWALAVALLLAPWIASGDPHPWWQGWQRVVDPAARPAALPDAELHAALDAVDEELAPDLPLAIRWQAPHDAAALGYLWVTAGYRLAPRPVFPLLHDDELRSLTDADLLDPALAEALGDHAAAVRRGDGVAVVWGDATPCRLAVPGLAPVRREGPLCQMRAIEAAP